MLIDLPIDVFWMFLHVFNKFKNLRFKTISCYVDLVIHEKEVQSSSVTFTVLLFT